MEPSKVGAQHISLIEGYLTALSESKKIASNYNLVLSASKLTIQTLPRALTKYYKCIPVLVMNPEKRRLVLKTLVELAVVVRYVYGLKKGDILFISCLLPTTLWLLEMANRYILKKEGIRVVLHGELEGLFAKETLSIFRLGYWSVKWLNTRSRKSLISLVVLDDFIRDKILSAFPNKIDEHRITVIHHPISTDALENNSPSTSLSVCFIGYRTKFKSFDSFVEIAKKYTDVEFLAIGGGVVENVRSRVVTELETKDDYILEISKCSMALFPYTFGYSCSLSASALDALAAGVYIVAHPEPFFENLSEYFGNEIVKICQSEKEMGREFQESSLRNRASKNSVRLRKVAKSKYGLSAVRDSFEKMLKI